jgi:hypothetical protein
MHMPSKVCRGPPGMEHSMYQHLRHRSSGQTGLLVHLRFVPGAGTPPKGPTARGAAGGGGIPTTSSRVAAAGVGVAGPADGVSPSSLLLLLLLLLQCAEFVVLPRLGCRSGFRPACEARATLTMVTLKKSHTYVLLVSNVSLDQQMVRDLLT